MPEIAILSDLDQFSRLNRDERMAGHKFCMALRKKYGIPTITLRSARPTSLPAKNHDKNPTAGALADLAPVETPIRKD